MSEHLDELVNRFLARRSETRWLYQSCAGLANVSILSSRCSTRLDLLAVFKQDALLFLNHFQHRRSVWRVDRPESKAGCR